VAHIHSDDQYDFTASAVVVHDDKALLLFHKKQQMWLNPGGHIELDENIVEALYRELEEETGLTKDDTSLVLPYDDNLSFDRDPETNETQPVPFDIDIHQTTPGGHRHIDLSYIFVSKTAEVKLEEEGATDIKWFTVEEMRALPDMEKKMFSRAKYAMEYVRGVAA
jgi:8-oxo-dGTP pyrophosphatase MutT (NUDIX family)